MQPVALLNHQHRDLTNKRTPQVSREAFNLILTDLRPGILLYCESYLKNRDDGEEACQDTLLKAIQAFNTFEGRSSIKTWLYRIATNVCASYYHQRQRYTSINESEVEQLIEYAECEAVERCPFSSFIQMLSVQERNVMSFRFLDELQFPEIAKVLDMNLSTVKMCYYRALSKCQRAEVS
jgi:RNA polymerase sigma-70 factor (ECF subfamily)